MVIEKIPSGMGDEDKPKEEEPKSILDRTEAAANRVEEAIPKANEAADRIEKATSDKMLAGDVQAQEPKEPEKSEEEKKSDATRKAFGAATGAKWAEKI